MTTRFMVALGLLALFAAPGHASDAATVGPLAATRSYGQNYRDMVLAVCIANAYRADAGAAKDAGSSVSALRDWTEYDMEHSADAIRALVSEYLARDYSNPVVEGEVKGVRFDLLKCLDLYHSKALDAQVKRFVAKPRRSYRQDNPPAGGR